MCRITLLALSLIVLAGCGAKLTTTRIHLPARDCVCGLVVNQYEPHTAYAVFPEAPASKTMKVQSARVMVPAKNEAYVIGYRGAIFASRELTVTLNTDGSLQEVKLTGEMQAAQALDAIAKSTDTLVNAEKTLKEEAEKAKKNPLDVENEELKVEIKNMMLKANKDALDHGQPLPYPNVN